MKKRNVNKIKSKIKNDKILEACELLEQTEYSDKAIIFTRRATEVLGKYNSNEITYETYNVEKNRISKSILDTIKNNKNPKRKIPAALFFIFILAIITVIIIFFNHRKNQNILIPENNGYEIDTTKNSIKIKKNIESVSVGRTNEKIYTPSESTDVIMGRISTDGNIKVSGVNIYTLLGDSTISNKSGYFTLKINREKYRKRFYIYYTINSQTNKKLVGITQKNIIIEPEISTK